MENKIESSHAGGGRMARIGMGTMITPASRLHQASFDASQSRCQEVRRQASSGEPAINQEPELRAGAGSGNADAAALQQASIRLKASEQVEARHHQKQHIIPPTNMAASCIFCKIIKGRPAV